jgi:hypothetical protein
MAAGSYEMSIEQGAAFSLLLTITDSEAARVDLTGHTFRGQIRKTYSSTDIVVSFTFTLSDQTSGATRGQVTVSLTATQTAAITVDAASGQTRPETKYIYDIESETGAGVVTRWLQGLVKVSPEVTK